MTASLQIQPIEPDVVPVAYNLLYELARYEELELAMTSTVTDLHALMFGEQACLYGIIAWDEDEPLGVSTWFYNASTFMGRRGLFIEDLFVLPAYRRQGIGKALLDYLVKHAGEQNCSFMDWAALKWNKPALSFYEKIGANIRDEWCLLRLYQ